jgi:hypothetical protein
MATKAAVEWMFSTLEEDLWRQLGPQKYMVGRRVVRRATAELVRNWPLRQYLADHVQDEAVSRLKRSAIASAAAEDKRYGFFWTLILSAVIGQLVRLLLEWWLEKDENKTSLEMMRAMKQKDFANAQ